MVCLLTSALLVSLVAAPDIKPDETVIFFETAASRANDSPQWIVPIHGWIFERERDSLTRQALIAAFREALDLDDDDATSAVFQRHIEPFLVDNERGKTIAVRIADRESRVGTSAPDGHFRGELRIPVSEADARSQRHASEQRWLDFEAAVPVGDHRRFPGSVLLLDPQGISVISDIDDTVRITNTRDPKHAAINTFLREFKPVARMAEVYRVWAARGAAFHYVSDSPWQLYEPLTAFMTANGFPKATFELKSVRLKDRTILDLLESPLETKPQIIERFMNRFPQRQIILVGDSGQKDPEIYGQLARLHPLRIAYICIRNVTGERIDSQRFAEAFEGIPPHKCRLFEHAQELLTLQIGTDTAPATSTCPGP